MPLEIRPSTTKLGEYAIYKDGKRTPQGLLSYKWAPADLRDIEVTEENDPLWTAPPIFDDTKRALLPARLKPTEWQLVALVKKEVGTDIWLKGALVNTLTGKVALITASNSDSIAERTIDSHNPAYKIGHYGMLAPMVFWRQLKAII